MIIIIIVIPSRNITKLRHWDMFNKVKEIMSFIHQKTYLNKHNIQYVTQTHPHTPTR